MNRQECRLLLCEDRKGVSPKCRALGSGRSAVLPKRISEQDQIPAKRNPYNGDVAAITGWYGGTLRSARLKQLDRALYPMGYVEFGHTRCVV